MKATIDESLASSVIAYHGDPLKLKVLNVKVILFYIYF
jgi:hypothetical protein